MLGRLLLTLGMMTVLVAACGLSEEEEAERAQERENGFHCLSAWDGNHNGLEELVRDVLSDPGSLETVKTSITPVQEDGTHIIFMDFTAKNAFGGRVRNTAMGTVDNETCEAVLTTVG